MSEKKFKKVGVLMGGPSAERDVSLRSGAAIAGALRTRGYDVLEIDLKTASVDVPAGVEAVFVALHGEFGEDGGVQAILRERKIPYTGSGPEASELAFDKVLSFSQSTKADDAQLKIGLCYLRMGKKPQAKESLNLLVNRFPASEYVPRAKKYLADLN